MTFTKGDKNIWRKGRPKGKKNKLTEVKDSLIKILSKKLKNPEVIKDLDINQLIRFTGQVIPKDMTLKVTPDVTYISKTPRPDNQLVHDVNSSQSKLSHDNKPKMIEAKVVKMDKVLPLEDNNTESVSLSDT
jgi:hypothetical protein